VQSQAGKAALLWLQVRRQLLLSRQGTAALAGGRKLRGRRGEHLLHLPQPPHLGRGRIDEALADPTGEIDSSGRGVELARRSAAGRTEGAVANTAADRQLDLIVLG
jgi:hypothetical protein